MWNLGRPSTGKRGGYAENSAALEAQAVAAIADPGDAIMVKGSPRFEDEDDCQRAGKSASSARPRTKRRYSTLNVLLADRASNTAPGFGIFKTALNASLHHLPHRRCRGDGRAVRIPFSSLDNDHLRLRQGKGQPIRTDGPQSTISKKGTPTMGVG